MNSKNIIITLLAVAVAVLCFFFGYRTGEVRDLQKQESEFRISVELSFYKALQRGEVQKVQNQIGIILLSETRYYEHTFGFPTGTNFFTKHFAAARELSLQIERTMVPLSSLGTNFGTNIIVNTHIE